jgi:hypothetical protein
MVGQEFQLPLVGGTVRHRSARCSYHQTSPAAAGLMPALT